MRAKRLCNRLLARRAVTFRTALTPKKKQGQPRDARLLHLHNTEHAMQARARAWIDPGHCRPNTTSRYRNAARLRYCARRASGLQAWNLFSVLSWASPERSPNDARNRTLIIKLRKRGLKSPFCWRPFWKDMKEGNACKWQTSNVNRFHARVSLEACFGLASSTQPGRVVHHSE